MTEPTYLRLQASEGIVCAMASRILAAFIGSGQFSMEREEELLDRAARLALRLAQKVDRSVESDDERGERA